MRGEIRFENGIRCGFGMRETFDAVIVDATDPAGPAEPPVHEAFYRAVSARLSSGGILIAQAQPL